MSKINLPMPTLDDIFSTQEMRDDAKREKIMEIPIEELHPFKNHPYKVVDNDELRNLAKSIWENGVLTPAIARARTDGAYELISGHRRRAAAILAGIKTLPVVIREMDDDVATIIMVDSNQQRENLLPSEKAFSYKMKLDAMKRQGQRTDLTSVQLGQKLSRKNLSEQTGDSQTQIQRYIRFTNLVPALLEMVDNNKIAISPAVELSYLTTKEQEWVTDAIKLNDCTPSFSQSVRLKNLHNQGSLDMEQIYAVMGEEKANQREKITFPTEKLKKYFPKNYSAVQMEQEIIKLLEDRVKKRERDAR